MHGDPPLCKFGRVESQQCSFSSYGSETFPMTYRLRTP